MCPFSILAFLQPTTVDKEPLFVNVSVLFLFLQNQDFVETNGLKLFFCKCSQTWQYFTFKEFH